MINFWDNFDSAILNRKNSVSESLGLDCPEVKRSNTYTENVRYQFNEFGFRSESFDLIDKDSILFSGCSITEGIGLPYEHIWFNQLELDRKVFNLSLAGTGLDTIIRNIYILLNKFGKRPGSIFLLIPPLFRLETFSSDDLGSSEEVYYFNPFNSKKSPNNFWHIKKAESINIRERFHDAYGKLLFLNSFLESKDIKFAFSMWDFGEYPAGTIKKIEHFGKNLPSELKPLFIPVEFNRTSSSHQFKELIAHDMFHPGPNCHFDFANNVREELNEKLNF